MNTRREFLNQAALGAAAVALPWNVPIVPKLISNSDREFLKELAKATLVSATRQDSVAHVGFPVVTPGGNYPAFWVRDFSMAIGTGLVSPNLIKKHLLLIAQVQNGGEERTLKSGGIIPPYAIPDHINFDGSPVFYPGTYSAGQDQGADPWGPLPPIDDHFEFVHIAVCLWKLTKSADFLNQKVAGLTVFERLSRAVASPVADVETGIVLTGPPRRAVGFGFCDTVMVTGKILYPTLLRYRALGEMVELGRALGKPTSLTTWRAERKKIEKNLAKTFQREGWLIAATGIGQQPDVWGTAFAIQLGLLPAQARQSAIHALVTGIKEKTICLEGAIRHVPTDHDFSDSSAWEKTAGVPKNQYQNGAYWHVPSGMVARAIFKQYPELARNLIDEMVSHFKKQDFRNGGGAPWECFHPDANHRQNPVYLASVTMPYEALK